jgi:hypothetical protein
LPDNGGHERADELTFTLRSTVTRSPSNRHETVSWKAVSAKIHLIRRVFSSAQAALATTPADSRE